MCLGHTSDCGCLLHPDSAEGLAYAVVSDPGLCRIQPLPSPACGKLNGNQRENRSGTVDQHVPYGSIAGGNEMLVELIARRVRSYDEQCKTNIGPGVFLVVRWSIAVQQSPDQGGQNCIFTHVCGLAYENYDRVRCFSREAWEQPMKERFNEPRRMLKLHLISRGTEDDQHPQEHRDPMREKSG